MTFGECSSDCHGVDNCSIRIYIHMCMCLCGVCVRVCMQLNQSGARSSQMI
jgi:hypothetical protein